MFGELGLRAIYIYIYCSYNLAGRHLWFNAPLRLYSHGPHDASYGRLPTSMYVTTTCMTTSVPFGTSGSLSVSLLGLKCV